MPSRRLRSLLLPLILALSASCAAANAPRLWEISGKNAQGIEGKFYLLPVTHNGLDSEYDDYFNTVIVPAALRADVFLQESAPIIPSQMPACAKPLADTAENGEILRRAFIDTERAEYDLQPRIKKIDTYTEQDWIEIQQAEHWFAHNAVSKLTEYGLIVFMGQSLYNFLIRNPDIGKDLGYKPRPDIADYLQHQRCLQGIKANEPIELGRDLAEAYCNIDPATRGRYLQREIGLADPATFTPLSREALQLANTAFDESIKNLELSGTFANVDKDEYSDHVVCDRNVKWLKKMRNALGIDIRFYAVGIAHVMQPFSKGQPRCVGLLKQLRAEGFSVQLVTK